jgi:hypothetical protein
MHRIVFIIVCVFAAGICVSLEAQIPENAQFQPGSYAFGPYQAKQSVRHEPVKSEPVAADAQSEDNKNVDGEKADESSETEWEKKFSPQKSIQQSAVPAPQPYAGPYLAYSYNHWTHRFHLVPYEPGYAANPDAFPVQTSPLHTWVSSLSSASQPSPQVRYMSYYDPDPVILPAEIRLRGSRFGAAMTNMQPMPLPIPKPGTARPVSAPARTRFGERLRQNLGTFTIQ